MLFVRGEEGVDEAVDEVGVVVVGGGDDVGVPPGVDLPDIVGETGDAEVGGGWAAGEHLVLPEVGAVAEVGGGWAEGGLGEGAHIGSVGGGILGRGWFVVAGAACCCWCCLWLLVMFVVGSAVRVDLGMVSSSGFYMPYWLTCEYLDEF